MHSKLHIATATVLGTVLVAGTSFAQSADSDRYAQPAPTVTASTHRTGPTCPAGCVAAPTPQDQARVQRERAARRTQRRAKEDEYASEQSLAQQRSDAERAEDERLGQIKTERLQAERDLAERERIAERERLEASRLQTTATTRVRAVGGGPGEARPRLNLSADMGVGNFTHGMQNAGYVGPTLGMRAGISLTPWFEIEGRMMAMGNRGFAPNVGEDNHLLTGGTAAVARINIPMRVISPYFFTGFGTYRTSVVHVGDGSETSLQHHNTGGIPMGTGVMVPISRRWQIGAEGSYNYLFDGQGYSTNPRLDTHGFWTANSVLRVSM